MSCLQNPWGGIGCVLLRNGYLFNHLRMNVWKCLSVKKSIPIRILASTFIFLEREILGYIPKKISIIRRKYFCWFQFSYSPIMLFLGVPVQGTILAAIRGGGVVPLCSQKSLSTEINHRNQAFQRRFAPRYTLWLIWSCGEHVLHI